MSRATVIQLLWWLVAWNLGSLLEFTVGGSWTLVGIAAGTVFVLVMRVRALPLRSITSAAGQSSPGQV